MMQYKQIASQKENKWGQVLSKDIIKIILCFQVISQEDAPNSKAPKQAENLGRNRQLYNSQIKK